MPTVVSRKRSEVVGQPTILVATDAHADVKCNGGSDGSVTVTFSGGTAPYMVNFAVQAIWLKTFVHMQSSGRVIYTLPVKDANGCN
jgi:hypothetical protein